VPGEGTSALVAPARVLVHLRLQRGSDALLARRLASPATVDTRA
jgi:hypothetical protein